MLLKNKVILLTGGTEGIGFECAKAYLLAGARLCIISNSAQSIGLAKKELDSTNVLFAKADVSIATEIEDTITTVVDHFGTLDVIHNNAGISDPSKAVHETSSDEWDTLFNVNVKGIYHTTKYGVEALRKSKGNILNTGSLVGEIGQHIHAAYSATKGAVNALTKSMALDYAPLGIRVNAVAPAGVWTPMLRNWSRQQPDTTTVENYLDNIHALGYCPEADVVADACVFLVSDKARFITGCILPVTGGAELGYRSMMNRTIQERKN
ncbi:MAG: SDR family oxidoreductase [Mucilaginibacter sp.]|uniref:SDR family NAD(P)-dependent oxidoreductase n=1 Tax=Mucilaginibacter sp. TaxID=1882438 RepID=UPI0031B1E726